MIELKKRSGNLKAHLSPYPYGEHPGIRQQGILRRHSSSKARLPYPCPHLASSRGVVGLNVDLVSASSHAILDADLGYIRVVSGGGALGQVGTKSIDTIAGIFTAPPAHACP